MIKNKKGFDIDNEIYEDIGIDEIDKEINKFHIDKEKIENIKYSFDKEGLIKDAIDKAEKDMDKNKIKLEIFSQHITIVTDESEEYTRSLASELNSKVSEMFEQYRYRPMMSAVALCAMRYCDENRKLRDELSELSFENESLKLKIRELEYSLKQSSLAKAEPSETVKPQQTKAVKTSTASNRQSPADNKADISQKSPGQNKTTTKNLKK